MITERLPHRCDAQAILTLPFEQRQKCRLRTRLDNGEEVGLMLPRGAVLRNGECLRAENGLIVELKAAAEPVSTVHSDDNLLLQRACYHLGNRHVLLQIGGGWIRYLQDHVLDDMVRTLGLSPSHEHEPFEPEAGAYRQHHADRHHGHSHD
jgi:urease accessory protein